MTRIYLKNKLNPRQKKFKALAEKLGADYIEDNVMVFLCKTKPKNNYRVGVQLFIDKGNVPTIGFGQINEDCNNLEKETLFNVKEQKWLVKLLKTINKEMR